MLVDAHCHVGLEARNKKGAETEVQRGLDGGVGQMVLVGTCRDDWQTVLHLAEKFGECVLPMVGLHPWFIREHWKEDLSEWRAIVKSHPVGVGEVGLDRACKSDWEVQVSVLQAQTELAAELKRPVSLHVVRATGKLLEIFPDGGPSWRIHGFHGNRGLLVQVFQAGMGISCTEKSLNDATDTKTGWIDWLETGNVLIESDAKSGATQVEILKNTYLSLATHTGETLEKVKTSMQTRLQRWWTTEDTDI